MDCLLDSVIHSINTFKPPNHECDKWCIDHQTCGGYTVEGNKCLFKNVSCKDNLFSSEQKTTYIPQGIIGSKY